MRRGVKKSKDQWLHRKNTEIIYYSHGSINCYTRLHCVHSSGLISWIAMTLSAISNHRRSVLVRNLGVARTDMKAVVGSTRSVSAKRYSTALLLLRTVLLQRWSGTCSYILLGRRIVVCSVYYALQKRSNWYRPKGRDWKGDLSLVCWPINCLFLARFRVLVSGSNLPKAFRKRCSSISSFVSSLRDAARNTSFLLANCGLDLHVFSFIY